ncbi:hypothetical protein CCHL11_01573 [Colletotrichum chlorophyti]|uniref:DUF7918 domain-containing protein n=1 Tax=Colletotrichum chlorophyti TaxID=708187 RepID=A0A1Q8RYV7_9PEZI|nr:hypothetical protein CCHL11_01573 [Colletotrichum chlorophyti]
MAVIDTISAVKVTVRLHTSFDAAEEYPDPYQYYNDLKYLDNFEQTSRNYIKSQSGVEFSVNIEVADEHSIDPWVWGDEGFLFFLYIDGQFMGRRFCFGKEFKPHRGGWRYTFKNRRHPNDDRTAMLESNFKFETVTTVDEDASDDDYRRGRDLGTIEVQLRLRKLANMPDRLRKRNLERPFRDPQIDLYQIAEKALKGRPLYHGTSFTRPKRLPMDPPCRNVQTARAGPLLATYHFKYRSRGSPEPLPRQYQSQSGGDAIPRFEDLPTHEIERLARERLRQMRDEGLRTANQKKRTYDDYYDLTEEHDQPVRPFKMIKLDNGQEAIDLTSDY